MANRNRSYPSSAAKVAERLGLVLLGGLLAVGIMYSAQSSEAPAPARETSRSENCPHVSTRRAQPATVAQPVNLDDDEEEGPEPVASAADTEPEELTRDVLGALEYRVTVLAGGLSNQSPEHVVNANSEYMAGTLDMLMKTPEMIPALAAQLETALCDAEKKKSQTLSMMYMRAIHRAPELGTRRAFDCFFEAHAAENAVLWEGLDALKGADIDPPAALASIQKNAVLPQTRRRFMSREELDEALQKTRGTDAPVAKPLVLRTEDIQRLIAERTQP